jgi:DNA-binding response OmpR family regulator
VSEPTGRTILVVEDEEAIRVLIEKLLVSGGHRVVATGEPARAVELARRENPDLVLCDIAMPEMDGYAVLRALQADPTTSHFPVVFLTAAREFTERVRAFRFGVVDYVTKPFTREMLLRRVERILEGRRERTGLVEEAGGDKSVAALLAEVQREARSGILTVQKPGGEAHAVIAGGAVVESTLPRDPTPGASVRFQELDMEREHIVPHDPARLPGDPSVAIDLESLPAVLRTVLIVDDNPDFRGFLREALARRGFTVHEAGDGEEGLRVALEKRPWLILTDVSMPNVHGFEFCRRVRGHSLIRHTPLLFLSGWDDYKDRYRGMEAGADDFLSKDTSIRELLIRIQLVLKRYSDLGSRAWRGPGMEGRIELIGVPSLLQMCHLGSLSGVLSVGSGRRKAELRFRGGEIVGVEVDGSQGEEALYDLLSWSEGHFSFAPGDPGPGPSLGESFSQLLLEGCRRLDEAKKSG